MDKYAVLKEAFGLNTFRGLQEPVIDAILKGESCVGVMPTGMGKSLCFQLPALMLPGLTLVVSPLIALMKDQVDAARKQNIKAAFINSSQTPKEREKTYQDLGEGKVRLLFVTPERFRKAKFWQEIQKNEISLLAIDEAHCISQWGHDFRPDYSRLGEIKAQLGNPVTVALTATATIEVQEDILQQLEIASDQLYVGAMDRPELALAVEPVFGVDEKVQKIVFFRHHVPGAGIIYCSLVSTLQKLSGQLRQLGLEHLTYHGQMPAPLRKKNQDQFIKGENQLILATPAFGLGINKPDVRSVLHAEVPGSIEAYYQEVGRGGRDGQLCECAMLFDQDDLSIQMDFIKWSSPDPHFIRSVYNYIKDHPLKYQQLGADFIRERLNFYNRKDFRVETAINLLERWEVLRPDKVHRHIVTDELSEDYLDVEGHKKKLTSQNKKLLDILQFAQGDEHCRKEVVHRYFGHTETQACGICDICKQKKEEA